jgi:MFS family permease
MSFCLRTHAFLFESPQPMSDTVDNSKAATPSVYNRVFWLAYMANLTMVGANALTFRFAELVSFLGGTEQTTGVIVQVGMLGALFSRLFLGQLLDRFGTRPIWLLGSLLFGASAIGFFFCDSTHWPIYLSRMAFAVGVAAISTAAIVHIQNQVPSHRRTEVIGNFGSSGFIGMILGSQAGDLVFWLVPEGAIRYQILFGAAFVLVIFYVWLVLAITRGTKHVPLQESPGPMRLIFRYWPGHIVVVAIMMGVGLASTTVFLTRMTTGRELGGIGTFFLGYCVSAFIFRVAAAGWANIIGRYKLVVMGLLGHASGHLILAFASQTWHLIPAAMLAGFGHALLFPCVVSLGSGRFPKEYRGTGTSIVLAFIEVGVACSAPLLGWMIDYGIERRSADPYMPMFLGSAVIFVVVACYYGWMTRKETDDEQIRGNLQVQAEVPACETRPARRAQRETPVTQSNG